MRHHERLSAALALVAFVVSLVLALSGCSFGRCTSHPYDPKAACAAPGATLGPADAGQE